MNVYATPNRLRSLGTCPWDTDAPWNMDTFPPIAINTTMNHRDKKADNVDLQQPDVLAARVFALDEPWRSRFIEVIASRAEGASQAEGASRAEGASQAEGARSANHTPTQHDIAAWLREQTTLSQQVRVMLRAWTHGRS